jgi:hypothetical protein
MKIEDLIKAKREEIVEIAAKNGARNVRIFDPSLVSRPIWRAIWIFLRNFFPGQRCSANRP